MLALQDIRPSPNPSQELQRAMASLPRDNWPEIFHTLNSVRRLAMHHAPLLGSQSHLHALVRDVLGQAENLRSQVGIEPTNAVGNNPHIAKVVSKLGRKIVAHETQTPTATFGRGGYGEIAAQKTKGKLFNEQPRRKSLCAKTCALVQLK